MVKYFYKVEETDFKTQKKRNEHAKKNKIFAYQNPEYSYRII